MSPCVGAVQVWSLRMLRSRLGSSGPCGWRRLWIFLASCRCRTESSLSGYGSCAWGSSLDSCDHATRVTASCTIYFFIVLALRQFHAIVRSFNLLASFHCLIDVRASPPSRSTTVSPGEFLDLQHLQQLGIGIASLFACI
jgi:hypothetical protein